MSRFIALVDGSIYSKSVCEHAAWIAGRTGSAVEVLHVLGRREMASAPSNLSGSIALGARTSILEELSALDEQRAKLSQKRGWAILDDAKALIEAGGVSNVTTRLRIGDLVEEVAESETDSDMVVIGKRGEAADFAKMHLGSNLERIVRSVQKPVFVAARAFKPIDKILIAFDGGPSSMKAVDHVARSTLYAGLKCRLVMVGSETSETAKQLAGAKTILQAGGYSVDAAIIPGQAEKAILDTIEADAVDLLVMGAYGHSKMRNLIIGSTTTEMVRLCKIPVVLYR
ncbi:universal stress protein [Bauldia litoralis]|uniref:Nucleotide-binding universal stress protein, UspA family n=1 Tax=Bauldia litoralis TaxID=665467 RepID=A0A1G6DED4_9HYPH|nr:universal stress protein [Bauldia litoralis]SDB43492.1 Nucleotide-binding universal stress protein, UspA family [Bauldia litoralis]